VESYIHRAGRTGRAGRNGVCIIFYKMGQEWGVQAVEKKAVRFFFCLFLRIFIVSKNVS